MSAAFTFRPIEADDKAALSCFFRRLSDESRRRRFLGPKPKLSGRDLAFLTEVDQRRHVALVALDAADAIVAVARYAAWPDEPGRAEMAFAVVDEWHGRGLGTALGDRLVAHARASGLTALTGSTFALNAPAKALLQAARLPPQGHLLRASRTTSSTSRRPRCPRPPRGIAGRGTAVWMSMSIIHDPALYQLRHALRGHVYDPGEPEYEDACTLFNGMIERRRATSRAARTAHQVSAALAFARARDMRVAVRGGGHSVAGLSLVDDGLVIDVRGLASSSSTPSAASPLAAWAAA